MTALANHPQIIVIHTAGPFRGSSPTAILGQGLLANVYQLCHPRNDRDVARAASPLHPPDDQRTGNNALTHPRQPARRAPGKPLRNSATAPPFSDPRTRVLARLSPLDVNGRDRPSLPDVGPSVVVQAQRVFTVAQEIGNGSIRLAGIEHYCCREVA